MVVREDGTKWACQSCLKGHRVSGCTHTDRDLILVPKKGRPVTQCQHCRHERKKRSAHVKCDCGEAREPHHPKEKCIHLREAEERAKAGYPDDHSPESRDKQYLLAVAEEQGCCCLHGGSCTCAALKKEPGRLADLPHGPAVQKPRLEASRSDGSLTVFANGHHKPVHRKNHAAHECGMPYKMPMPRAHTDQNIATVARRSVDSLVLDGKGNLNAFTWTSPACSSSATDRDGHTPERVSPKVPHGGLMNVKLGAVDLNALGPSTTRQSVDSESDLLSFPPLDPMSAAADSSYDPWSALPSAEFNALPDNNPFVAWATNYDTGNGAQPALTAASSGTQSEIDEMPLMDDLYGFPMPSIQEDDGALNMDMNASEGANLNRRSLPPNFFGNADFSLPPIGDDEWTMPLESKMVDIQQPIDANGWSASNVPIMTSLAQRSPDMVSTATTLTGRPQSHSVGPRSAPSEDIMKQLFPDIDVNGPVHPDNTSAAAAAAASSAAWKRFGGMTDGGASSINYPELGDDQVAFNSQPWTDGSVSVPNDAFTTPFNLEQDYPTPDFDTWQR